MYSLAYLSSYTWTNSFGLFRLHELLLLVLSASLCFHIIATMSFNVMHAPKAFNSLDITSISLANNTDFSYPMRVKSSLCWPKQLLTCIEAQSNASLSKKLVKEDGKLMACCTALWDPSSVPYQTVDGDDLVFYGLTVPALLLTARVFFWWLGSFRLSSAEMLPMLTWRFWLFLWWESILTLVFASTYQTVLMEFIKSSVGAPRPIFHALNIWASVGLGRAPWRHEAHRSFPSGHSATAASGLGIVMILLMRDAHFLLDSHPLIGKAVAHVAVLPFAVTVYVGITRIRDYWHFPVDVTGKILQK